jgi:uncharacterized protein (DUF58 family)
MATAEKALLTRHRAEQAASRLPPLLLAAERIAATVAQGVHGRRRVGLGETFWQFRHYEPGDAAQRIDWRQSAKSQGLFVRETEWEAAQSVWLWRDASPSMQYQSARSLPEKAERADLLTLALAALMVRAGERVALLGAPGVPQVGPAALERMAITLASPAKAPPPSLPPFLPLPRYAQLVLIGDFLSSLDEVEFRLKRFAAQGQRGYVLQVLDPAEETLPFAGRARFEGLEGEGRMLIKKIETLRGDYRGRVFDHIEGLRTICRRIGWGFGSHRTDRPPESALLNAYMAMSATMAR